MNRFLDELAAEAKAAPKPSLAQRSLAMARDISRQKARQDEEGSALLERRPNTPPPEPFSLDLYVDGVVKRLNRSAAFVRNDRIVNLKPVEAIVCEGSGIQSNFAQKLRAAGVPLHIFRRAQQRSAAAA